MLAIVQDRYGGPEVLELREVPDPEPGPLQVRVRVRASSVNAADWHMMRGDPRIARLSIGVRRPKAPVRGRDVAGVVEAVGASVTRWQAGDEVYGDLGEASGGFAELVCVAEEHVDRIPAGLTFEQAGVVPLAGRTAYLCIQEHGRVSSGQRVLVVGASGGVGTFAVQVAAHLGAEVTAVCSTRNVDLARSMGADHVVDYTRDSIGAGAPYDVVVDLAGTRSLRALLRLVARDGTLVLSGGGSSEGGSWLGPVGLMARAAVLSRMVGPRLCFPQTPPDRASLEAVSALVEAGAIRPHVERTYKLAEVPAAIRHLETAHARTKLGVSVG